MVSTILANVQWSSLTWISIASISTLSTVACLRSPVCADLLASVTPKLICICNGKLLPEIVFCISLGTLSLLVTRVLGPNILILVPDYRSRSESKPETLMYDTAASV